MITMKRVSHIAIAVLMCVSTVAYADDIKVNLADCVATNGNISVSASVKPDFFIFFRLFRFMFHYSFLLRCDN